MTLAIGHATVSVGVEAGDGEIGKTEWNEAHAITAGADVVLGTTTAGAVGEIACGTLGRALLSSASTASARATLGLTIGTNVQAYSPVLASTTASFTTALETKLGFITVTQSVDLDQMETDIAALSDGMVYKGDWDASVGTFPGAGAAQTGWFYYVSVAGTVGGVEFAVGDNLVATTDNASTGTFAANWSKHDQTGAVVSVAGLVGSITDTALRAALNVEDGATADQTDGEIEIAYNSQVAQISAPEIAAGTQSNVRRVSPADVKAMIDTHAAGGGSGDVVGPASSVADRIAVFDGVTGKLLKDGGSAIVDFTATPPFRFDTKGTFEAVNVDASVDIVYLAGYTTVGDGGAASYVRVASEPSHPGKIQSNDGAWWALMSGYPTPDMFGADGGGTVVDTTAIANACSFAGTASAFRAVKLSTGTYRTGSFTVPDNTSLIGIVAGRDTTIDNVDADYTTLGGALLLDVGATITANKGSTIHQTLIRPHGQTYPQSSSAAWAGTAITVAGYGVEICNNWIIGFDTGVSSNGFSRVNVTNNAFDCNNDIYLEDTFDTSIVSANRGWPYATHKHYADPALGGGANQPVSALLRTGIGLHLVGGNDDTRVNGNFFYGKLIGMQFDAGNFMLSDNWIDHPAGQARAGNIGMKFGEGATKIRGGEQFIWSCNTGVHFDQLGSEDVSLSSLSIEDADGDAIQYDSGTVDISRLIINGAGDRAIQFNSNSVRCHVNSMRVTGMTGAEVTIAANMKSEHYKVDSYYSDQAVGTDLVDGSTQETDQVASADPLNIPNHGDFFRVTGTTNFGTLNGAGSAVGRTLTLWFDGVLTVFDGGNMQLSGGNYVTAVNKVLRLRWNGFNWLEIYRSPSILNVGYAVTALDAGTKSTGTFTPDPEEGNHQFAVNGGAHTLAPPTKNCTMVVHYTNNGSAGAITTTGFTAVDGDSFTTTDTDEFICYITKVNDVSHMTVKAL